MIKKKIEMDFYKNIISILITIIKSKSKFKMEQLSKMINKFYTNYPKVAEKVSKLNQSYPIDLKLKMVINVSILMSKLEKGEYDEYKKQQGKKLSNEVIDMIAFNYINNYVLVADKVYEALGKYEPFPKLNRLQPDNFIKSLINQCCD